MEPYAKWEDLVLPEPQKSVLRQIAVSLVLLILFGGLAARAQDVPIPNFWDPRVQPERPDLCVVPTAS